MKKFSIVLCFALFCAVIFSGSVFASDPTVVTIPNYPTLTASPGDSYDYQYVVYKDTAGDIRLFVCFSTNTSNTRPYIKFTTNEENNRISYTVLKIVKAKHYVLRDNIWTETQSGYQGWPVGQAGTINSAVVEFLETNHEITLSDGTVVFPEPPVHNPTLAETILEGVKTAQGTILKVMMTIALCGVGYLASLMALPLLSKVFRRWL